MRGSDGLWFAASLLVACGGITERQVDGPMGGRDANAAGAHSSGGRGGNTPSGGGGSPPSSGDAGVAVSAGSPTRGGAPGGPQLEGSPCYNDIDCPGAECGGQVCDWTRPSPAPVGEKVFYCRAAGSAPPGADGWCTSTADCKCSSRGASCLAPYCTFTRPEDAR